MAVRSYGQYCGFARALEAVGERWALLIVRDLLVEPKRFGALQRGLPNIPSNILAARLRELEDAGIVERRAQARPAGGIAYQLTADGRELEPAVIALGRWGARRLGTLQSGEVVTGDSLVMALRTIFRAEAAGSDDLRFELRVGDIIVHAHVHQGRADVGLGPLAEPDLTIEAGPGIRSLLAGEISASAALRDGVVSVHGKRPLLRRFAELFRIETTLAAGGVRLRGDRTGASERTISRT